MSLSEDKKVNRIPFFL